MNVKALLKFEKLTTEVLVQWVFVLWGVGIAVAGLWRVFQQVKEIDGFRDFVGPIYTLGLTVASVLILRIACEITLLLFRALKKYTASA